MAYSKELEAVIEAALADGVITEKERAVLHKKALLEGVDPDDVDVVIEGRLAKMKREEDWLRPTPPKNIENEKCGDVVKCPNCGTTIEAGSALCKKCGYVFTMKMSDELEELIEAAVSDGVVTPKERDTLYRRAEREGFDIQLLDAKINMYLAHQESLNEEEEPTTDNFLEKKKRGRAVRPIVFDPSISNTRVVKKGLFIKNILRYNDKMIEYDHRYLQWPLSLTFKWIGFIGHKSLLFGFDSNLTYYQNEGKLFGKKTLYLSYDDYYDVLPTNEEELANDDADDLTFQKLNDGIGEENTSGVDISGDDHLDDDLYMMTETMQLRFKTEVLKDILSRAQKSDALEPKIVKIGGSTFNQRLLVYNTEWAFHVMPKFFSNSEIDSTPIHYMAFFLNKSSMIKSDVYCGYHRQIDMVSVPKNEALKFQDWCKDRAPRLVETGIDLSSSIWGNPLNLWRYLHPDKLALTSNAVVYTRKTFNRDEMIYLPYSRIKLFLTGKGVFLKNFEIYGEQNIVPKYSFRTSAVTKIKKIFENHGINAKDGTSYHSTYWFPRNWFGKAPLLITIKDTAIFYPRRIESKMKDFNGSVTRMSSVTLNEIEVVTWYKSLFSIFGTIVIEGTSKSIRTDQKDKSITIIIPELSMFCYSFFFFFSGPLKRFLRGGNNVSFERKWEKYVIV